MVLNSTLERKDKYCTFGSDKNKVQAINEDKCIRYLGVWINLKGSKKFEKQRKNR